MKTYSQVNQDIWVLETLKNKTNGYFLDIGAYDGLKFSNSYLLESDYNWLGLLVEAHPINYEKMISIRSNTCVNCAITNQVGFVNIDGTGDTGSKISKNGYRVKSTTFRELFKEYNTPNIIDYMSLDIEGCESISLEEFPFDTHLCLLITVEHNLYMGDEYNKERIKELLLNNGYEMVKENVSSNGLPFEDWYKHKTLNI